MCPEPASLVSLQSSVGKGDAADTGIGHEWRCVNDVRPICFVGLETFCSEAIQLSSYQTLCPAQWPALYSLTVLTNALGSTPISSARPSRVLLSALTAFTYSGRSISMTFLSKIWYATLPGCFAICFPYFAYVYAMKCSPSSTNRFPSVFTMMLLQYEYRIAPTVSASI